MDPILKIVLEALGGVAAFAGLILVYAAAWVVDRRGLAAKHKVDPRMVEHLLPEEVEKYKRDGAVLNVKLVGVGIAVPALLLIVFVIK